MTTAVTLPVPDPLYSQTLKPAPIQQDTSRRISKLIYPNEPVGTIATPLNAADRVATFTFTQGALNKYRWGGMGLELTMFFAVNANTSCQNTGVVYTEAPDWNLVARLFESVKLTFNGATTVYSSIPGRFTEDFTARLLHNRAWSSIENDDMMLFTPIGADRYTAASAVQQADTTLSPSYKARADKYCRFGNTQNRPITKIIPFTDLFPRLPDAIFRNLRSVQIDIRWKADTNLLSQTLVAATGRVHLTRARINVDSYELAPATSATDAEQKATEQPIDIIPFLYPVIHSDTYVPGMTIRIPGKANIESVMLFQLAQGLANAGTVNEARTYSGSGEFLFLSTHLAADAAGLLTAANQPPVAPVTSGLHSIRLVYGDKEYPSSPIELAPNSTLGLDFVRLYAEYKKAMRLFGHPSLDCIPFSIFSKTMPFAFFNPNAPDAPKQTSPSDLAIETTCGTTTATSKFVIVAFQHRILQLDAAGGAKIIGEN